MSRSPSNERTTMDPGNVSGIEKPDATDRTTPPRSCRMVETALSDLEEGSFEDRARISAVRKFCQAKPSVIHYDRKLDRSHDTAKPVDAEAKPDAALSALLRGLIYELDADLAMISLLDDRHQYFLAGVSRESIGTAKTFLESTKWYGCDFVPHHGGLCERTVRMQDLPAVYEELDLAANNRTSRLPFVNGTIANFRHYAGVPIITSDGLVIGTVFTFSNRPSEGLRQQQRKLLTEASSNVMKQLLQAVQALEGSRARLFSNAIASLLDAEPLYMEKVQSDTRADHPILQRAGSQHHPLILDIYKHAAQLLLHAFELDDCRFQEADQPRQSGRSSEKAERLLGESHRFSAPGDTAAQKPVLEETAVDYLVSHYPQGTVLHLTSKPGQGLFVTACGGDSHVLSVNANETILEAFPHAKQVLFMPMWDTIQNRVVSVALGSSASFDRVYTDETDLSMLSAFCTSSISQVRRVEGRVMDRTKTDFLGSVSHEMRSPLHAVLGSLELLTGTGVSDEQLDLIQSADVAGRQLLDTIDKVLHFTNINTPDAAVSSDAVDKRRDSSASVPTEIELLDYCEKIVAEVGRKTDTLALLSHPSTENKSPAEIHPLVIAMDAWPENTKVPLRNHKMLGVVLENLLANSVKYSGIDCCLRTALSISDGKLNLTITDCGRGIPQDFLNNHLFVPFSQVDHIEAGTGLGLPLVKRALDALEGTIDVQSNEMLGTSVTVVIPMASLARETNTDDTRADSKLNLQQHIASPLHAQLFIPPAWSSGAYGKKGDRLIDNLFSSLSRNLHGLVPRELTIWEPQGPTPSVIFVRCGDIWKFRNTCGKTMTGVGVIVVGGEAHPGRLPVQLSAGFGVDSGPAVEIAGPLLPSTLREALERVLDTSVSRTGLVEEVAALSMDGDDKKAPTNSKDDLAIEVGDDGQSTSAEELTPNDFQGNTHPTSASPLTSSGSELIESSQDRSQPMPKEPRMLLVDDNAVNLKLLRKFVQQCGIRDMASASGGHEAISLYDRAMREDRRFDICFMDLSMPEVDGFRATSEIRELEVRTDSSELHRLQIVALTGLASWKDRHAAVAAGVDEYITKPANMKTVQEVIHNWKRLRHMPTVIP